MTFSELDTVVLIRDLAEHGLRKEDVGTIVHVHDGCNFEVEFSSASGDEFALVALSSDQLRPASATDVLTVRSS